MIVKQLQLHNIRSYLDQKVSFPTGAVLLSGDIGSGKSTILLAIEFALFGTRRGELSGASLLRHGAGEGFVELTINIEDREVIVRRSLKRLKDDVRQDAGYIIVDGIKKDGTAVELRAGMLVMLGYPEILISKSKDLIYRFTVYTAQEEMKQILYEDKDVRLETLRRIFGVEKYKRMQENISLYARILRERIKEKEARIVELPRKHQLFSEKNERLVVLQGSIDGMRPQLLDIQKTLNRDLQKLQELEVQKQRLQELQYQLKANEAQLLEQEQQKKKKQTEIEELLRRQKEAELSARAILIEKPVIPQGDVESQLLRKDQEHRLLVEQKAVLTEKLQYLVSRIAEGESLRELRPGIEQELRSIEEALQRMGADTDKKKQLLLDIARAEQELLVLRQQSASILVRLEQSAEVEKAVSSLSICPTCMQDVSSLHKSHICTKERESQKALGVEAQQIQERIAVKQKGYAVLNQRKAECEALENKSAGLRREKELLAKQLADLLAKEKQTAIFSEKKNTVEAELENILKINPSTLQHEIVTLQGIRKMWERYKLAEQEKQHLLAIIADMATHITKLATEIAGHANEIGLASIRTKEILMEISTHSGVLEQIAVTKKSVEDMQKKERLVELQMVGFEKEQGYVRQQADELLQEINKMESVREELENIRKKKQWLEDFLMHLLSTMEQHVMLNVHAEFSGYFSKWFVLLMDDEEMKARLDESFSPVIEQNGYESFLENLSGGEKTALALAYRLSLNKVINDLIQGIKTKDIIILDEPTDGFSSEQLDRVKDVLSELHMKQIILVSHETKIENFVDTVIRVVKRGHVSQVI